MDLLEVVKGLGINLIWAALAATAAYFATRLRRRSRARALWPFSDYSDLTIVVARTEDALTGAYHRPQTGIGELRALALLAPSLDKASKETNFQRVLTGTASHHELASDLIVLGGPKNNEVTRTIFERLPASLGISQLDSSIKWKDSEYEGKSDEGRHHVLDDYGLVIRMKNPYSKRSVVVFSGSHTYGVIAAAKWYADGESERKSLPRSGKRFAALVHCHVDGEAITEPSLIRSIRLA